ncbi:hypothetical protein ACEPRU_17840 [Raoultella ornithinolytica]|uniref:hypothetical protein n=1 Tax=Raoultella ornithinolytica TaxID=54291 RepID=UPI00358F82F2
MSFTLIKLLRVNKSYPDLLLEVADGTEEVGVTYEVITAELNGNTGKAGYTVSVVGVTSAQVKSIEFNYSGNGNPVTEAEMALKSLMQ